MEDFLDFVFYILELLDWKLGEFSNLCIRGVFLAAFFLTIPT